MMQRNYSFFNDVRHIASADMASDVATRGSSSRCAPAGFVHQGEIRGGETPLKHPADPILCVAAA